MYSPKAGWENALMEMTSDKQLVYFCPVLYAFREEPGKQSFQYDNAKVADYRF